MGWDTNHEILTGPISDSDLAEAAGYPGTPHDLGWLIVNGLFNMWAKHKAFKSSSPGYAYDKTQATPELRSPLRVAAALAANYGMNIPIFNANDFKTHFADLWTWNRPTQGAPNERFRGMDFDGYVINYWQSAVQAFRLWSIFDSFLSVPGDVVTAGDLISFDMRCCDDPDSGLPGMLYPYAFLRDQASIYDLSKYYMGIGLLDSQNVLRVITGDRMDEHHTVNDVDASLRVNIPTACADGALEIIPLLASVAAPTWESSQNGNLISLHGAHLRVTKSATSGNIIANVTITIYSNYVRLDFSLQNISPSIDYYIDSLWAYLLSAGSYYNEYDPGYSGPYVEPPTDMYIEQTWPNTPALTQQHHSSPNILLSDRDGQSHSPDLVSAYGLDARGGTTSGFYHANGDSATLRHGTTVTWSQNINQIADGYGDYSDFAAVVLGINASYGAVKVETFLS